MDYSDERYTKIMFAMVESELNRATDKFAPFNNPHEAYAVILEELDELWDEIKANRGRSADAFNEARQIAAMAVRYMIDLVELDPGTIKKWNEIAPKECECPSST